MKTKSIFRIAVFALMIAMATPASSRNPLFRTKESKAPTEMESQRAQEIMIRLENIKAMDKSSMSRLEKRELRKEVKAMDKELRATSNGVYLSLGAIIIIILLLILLL
jgi:hypothetical protein